MRSTRERHLRLVLGAATWAAIFSVWVVFFGVDEIDLDAVTPWPKVSGVNRDGRGWATLIVFSLPIIAAIPLRFRDKSAVRASAISFALILGFVIISLLRIGLLYIPSALMLGLAARGVFDRKTKPNVIYGQEEQ